MTVEELVAQIKRSTQHRYLYHFTDEGNFNRIGERGLVSKQTMRNEGWWPEKTGGNELSHRLDTQCGIDPYVSLCFTTNHPMQFSAQNEGRLPNPRYLAILPEVLLVPGVQIAFGIANGNDTEILPLAEAIDRLDLEVIYTRTKWSDPEVNARLRAAEKMEILVPNGVERALIAGVM